MAQSLSPFAQQYAAAFPLSGERFAIAQTIFPCGVTHDARMMEPFPIYVSHAKGSRKWAIDGQEIIDYFVGHGSHLLGHAPDDVVGAVQAQMARGTHPGSCHELEIEWGQLVQKLIPSAERVRFTGSGTEATLMALRLARLFTGKPKTLKFQGHFHGWHDYAAVSADPPYEAAGVPGVPGEVSAQTIAIPPNDLNLVESTLQKHPDIGSLILEPTGGHWGAVPVSQAFLQGLREITTRRGIVLIFDEVITGFRVSPGGAQAVYGITPDLTTLAKILAGGLPGGCLAGRKEILDYLEPRPGKPKMKHPGTYNANPLSASAGITTLKRVATGEACRKANDAGRALRNGFNAMFARRGFTWIAYGEFSMIRILPGFHEKHPPAETADYGGFVPMNGEVNTLDGPKNVKHLHAIRQGMLLHGVDWWGNGGMTTCEHSEADIAQTILALEKTVEMIEEQRT